MRLGRKQKTDEERIREIAKRWPWTEERNAEGTIVWRANDWSITPLDSLYQVRGPGSAFDERNMAFTETLDEAKEHAVRRYLHEKAASELRRRIVGRY